MGCAKAHSSASARMQCEKLSPQTEGAPAAAVPMYCMLGGNVQENGSQDRDAAKHV